MTRQSNVCCIQQYIQVNVKFTTICVAWTTELNFNKWSTEIEIYFLIYRHDSFATYWNLCHTQNGISFQLQFYFSSSKFLFFFCLFFSFAFSFHTTYVYFVTRLFSFVFILCFFNYVFYISSSPSDYWMGF